MGAPCLIVPCPPGDYEVSIKFNEEHIPDSPFIVPVASHSDDARRLTVTSLQVLGTLSVKPWGTPGFTDASGSPRHSWAALSPCYTLGMPLCATFGSPVAPLDPLGPSLPPSCHSWGHLSLPHVTPRPLCGHSVPLCASLGTLSGASLTSLVSHCTPLSPLGPLCCPFVTLGVPWSHLSPPYVTIGALPGATSVSLALILGHLAPLCHP